MDLDQRAILRPKSQWSRAVSRHVPRPDHYTNSTSVIRRTEPMHIDDDASLSPVSTLPGSRSSSHPFWSFYNPALASSQSSPNLKRKHSATDNLGLLTTYQSALRRAQHATQQSELGTWYHLFSGEAAEMLMYWYHEGMSLQALTFLAKSDRLRPGARYVLVEGREMEMVKNFVYARVMNPQDMIRVGGAGWKRGCGKRLKTQEEEDETFICDDVDVYAERRLRRAGLDSGDSTNGSGAASSAPGVRFLSPGALARTKTVPYKLYRERSRRPDYRALGAEGLRRTRRRSPTAAPGDGPSLELVIEDYADPRMLFKLVDTACVDDESESWVGRRARAVAMDPRLGQVEGWEEMWRKGIQRDELKR